ncbi:hypothetical protein MF672_006505 [Actinomadura sp. ATCC 31491]|uniref:Uncharacterized protein n=1 Tax=Actinomadura luzonensis TaxID=2805427 RepID=A0ABT0FM98_9ACTN|nr:hypothetical protein [Actinomadura luzonensis]MCK2213445.1 hypothetical protein [Actinomadura luzonensis]
MPHHAPTVPRLVVRYLTHHDCGLYVCPLPLAERRTGVTHLVVGPPRDQDLVQMWDDVRVLRADGIRVLAQLDEPLARDYPALRRYLLRHRFDGADLCLPRPAALAGRLRADLGPGFLLTVTAPATALAGGDPDLDALCADRRTDIAWFTALLFDDHGTPADYEAVVARGLVPAARLVAAFPTSPDNARAGYVPPDRLTAIVRDLLRRHPDLGGVDGWEYYNALPGGTDAPWLWAELVHAALHP